MAEPRSALVVEDEAVVSGYLEMLLVEEGFVVLIARTGEAALGALAERPFDLVLADRNLPDMTGIELIREMRAARPGTRVMMLTAYGSPESALEALRAGASDYVLKPAETLDGFLGRLRAALVRPPAPERFADLTADRLPADPAEAVAALRQVLERA